jgi:hypothetical protein
MATVEERLSTLEAEIQAVKLRLSAEEKPRDWVEQVAGSMNAWPEFNQVVELGQKFRRSVRDDIADDPED